MPESRFVFTTKKRILFFLVWLLAVVFFTQKIDHTILFRRFVTHRTFTGDEPKYFRMVHSLWKDGDLDLSDLWMDGQKIKESEDRYREKGQRRFGDFYIVGINGGIFPIHMPGLAFWILPPFSLDMAVSPPVADNAPSNLAFLPRSLFFTRLWFLLTAVAVLGLLLRLCIWFTRSLIVSSLLLFFFISYSPFPEYSVKIYPGVTVAAFTLMALNGIFSPFKKHRLFNDGMIVLGIGFLPWFHQRFIPLSLGLLLAFFYQRVGIKGNLKKILPVCLLLGLMSLPYFFYFYSITGSLSPLSISAVYGKVFARLSTFLLGFFGHLLSEREGIFWWYPWTLFSLAGIFWSWKEKKHETLLLLMVMVPYYLLISIGIPWSGGTLPPGRFLLPLFPVFLLFCGTAISNLVRRFSWSKTSLYTFLIIFIFFYRRFRFIDLDFSYSSMTSDDVVRMVASMGILFCFFLLIYGGNKIFFTRQERNIWNVFSFMKKKPGS
ncbi:MAG: hypothetical protein JXB26_17640 [Candidatus Aminicenantes bacterium]|nr:hypothetical protein [Candidatus Aminicenantes bacterium]